MKDWGNFKQSGKFTGSSELDEPVFLVVGKLRRPHGILGEMQFELHSDFPERFTPGKTLYVGDHKLPFKIRGFRPHHNLYLISFDEFTTPEEIGIYRNNLVYIEGQSLPKLPEGDFYHHELFGLEVFTEEGRLLGILSTILETGANDVFVVRTPFGPDLLIPVIDEVIIDIQPAEGRITVRLLPGLEAE